ncbi:oligosaccharide flippase family protein [Methanobrevibacter sp.]|uniref:oligosaccharide flippase family protein n=1 Tax=Methanobrevibacter sp. TaxID=66852 RepID=UPI0025EBF7C6|nr:oligosaccharide flippase family protein [Methanobrevibacter sp.]MBQ6511875.1 oligosaccharide flippase family protein [Methanobrevibacter sp.]
MSQVKTIFKNMSWLLISQIIASICGFIWTILMARYLGVSKYGIFGFAVSLTGMMSILFDLGIGIHSVRHIATNYNSAPKYLGNVIPLKGLFSVMGFIAILIVLIIMKSNEITIIVTLLFAIEQIIKKFVELLNATFQAFEEGKYQGIGNTILNTLLLVFILIAIYTDMDLYGIAVAYILANVIALLYEYYVLKKYITQPNYEFDTSFCKKITIASIPFAATVILSSIYYSIDIVMLTNIVGDYATGIYNATYKLISVLTLFYSVYTAVIFPVMSKFYKNDEKMLLTSYEKSIKYLMIIIIPLAVSTMIYSTDIIHLFYGSEYDSASSVLSILIWTVCLLFISGAGNTLLNASHKEISVTYIYLIAAIFNVVLNLILIPKYSYNGAAITTVLSDVIIVIIQTYIIYKIGHRPDRKLYVDILKIIIGSTILGIALFFLNLNMWVAIPVGIIIYFLLIYLLRVFDDDDTYVLKEILGKN